MTTSLQTRFIFLITLRSLNARACLVLTLPPVTILVAVFTQHRLVLTTLGVGRVEPNGHARPRRALLEGKLTTGSVHAPGVDEAVVVGDAVGDGEVDVDVAVVALVEGDVGLAVVEMALVGDEVARAVGTGFVAHVV